MTGSARSCAGACRGCVSAEPGTCRHSAEPIAVRLGQAVERSDALLEIDFGAWTGTPFAELDQDPRWAAWNGARPVSRPPYGETMLEAQGRIVVAMEALRGLHR